MTLQTDGDRRQDGGGGRDGRLRRRVACRARHAHGGRRGGYGDGYPRGARPGTPVLIDGRRAPLIGRVSMDMITVGRDRAAGVRVGEPVVLWGGELPVEEVARARRTGSRTS